MVATGAPGGVGRYELLAARALKELQDAGEIVLDGIARREHPSYLSPDDEDTFPRRGQPLPIGRFALQALRAIRAAKPDLVLFTHVNLARLAPTLAVVSPGARSLTAT